MVKKRESDIPQVFTSDYYDEEYFAGVRGGKNFLREGGSSSKWSYYNLTGESHGCKFIADAFKKIFSPITMLDVGAGRGTLISYCREVGILAEGFDWSSWAVGDGRYQKCKSEWLRELDGTNPLPYLDGEFDLVTVLDYMEHMYVEDIDKVIKELHRITGSYILFEIAVVGGLSGSGGFRHEKGYIIRKGEDHPILREANMVAGHVTVMPEQYWIDKLQLYDDWVLRRDLREWFCSLVPDEVLRNWVANSILIFSKEED